MSEKKPVWHRDVAEILACFCGGVTLTVLVGCGDPCANKILSEAKSPDGKYVATAFISDCGATTGSSPQVHLRPIGAKRKSTGNVFVGDDTDKLRIEWLSEAHLVICSDGDVIRQDPKYDEVTIEKRAWP